MRISKGTSKVFAATLGIFFVLGAGQSEAMFKRAAISICGAAGLGTAGYFGNEYVRKPLKTMRQNKQYLLPQHVQDTSDELLDAMTDQKSLTDRLHTWYLKKFGYNKVFSNDPDGKFVDGDIMGYVKFCGGIHMRHEIINSPHELEGKIAHENGHLSNKDTTRPSLKIPFIARRKMTSSFVFDQEMKAEKKKVRALLKTGKYNALFMSFIEAKKLLPSLPGNPGLAPYVLSTLSEFQDLLKEYPEDDELQAIPIAYKLMQERQKSEEKPKLLTENFNNQKLQATSFIGESVPKKRGAYRSSVYFNENQNSIVACVEKSDGTNVTVIRYLDDGRFDISASKPVRHNNGRIEAPEQFVNMLLAKIAKYEQELEQEYDF